MASAREAADDAGQQRRPRVRLEFGGGGPQREHEHGDPAQPRGHREHVHDVRRQQHRDRLLHARVAAEGGQQREPNSGTASAASCVESAGSGRGATATGAGAVAAAGLSAAGRHQRPARAPAGGAGDLAAAQRARREHGSTSTQASAPMPQAVPKRVPSTSVNVSGRAAAQNEPPSPTAPWSTIAASADSSPATAAISRSRSSRAVNARETTPQRTPARRAGRSARRGRARSRRTGSRARRTARVFVIGPRAAAREQLVERLRRAERPRRR